MSKVNIPVKAPAKRLNEAHIEQFRVWLYNARLSAIEASKLPEFQSCASACASLGSRKGQRITPKIQKVLDLMDIQDISGSFTVKFNAKDDTRRVIAS